MESPETNSQSAPAAFSQRPWPRRNAQDSPFQHCRALCVLGAEGPRWATALSALGLPCVALPESQSMERAMERGSWDLILLGPESTPAPQGSAPADAVVFAIGAAPDGWSGWMTEERPFPADAEPAEVLHAFGRALETRALRQENRALRQRLEDIVHTGTFSSCDPAFQALLSTAEAVADTRATVLLLGESGTGKTRLARALHDRSSRRNAPFQVVHCGALPPTLLESELFGHAKGAFTGATQDRAGRFEAAQGGTIFLDEIQSAPLDLQVKLLRVLQERVLERVGESRSREIDVRIIAASNQDLEAAIERGEFREDLFWRLNVVSLTLPALRDRKQDLPALCAGFVQRFREEYERGPLALTPGALAHLAEYDWPGNIRQLENVIERAVVLCDGETIGPEHLPEEVRGDMDSPPSPEASLHWGMTLLQEIQPLKQAMMGPERAILLHALQRTGGNRSEAAERLGINRTTLFHKMRKHGLMDQDFDPGDSRQRTG